MFSFSLRDSATSWLTCTTTGPAQWGCPPPASTPTSSPTRWGSTCTRSPAPCSRRGSSTCEAPASNANGRVTKSTVSGLRNLYLLWTITFIYQPACPFLCTNFKIVHNKNIVSICIVLFCSLLCHYVKLFQFTSNKCSYLLVKTLYLESRSVYWPGEGMIHG